MVCFSVHTQALYSEALFTRCQLDDLFCNSKQKDPIPVPDTAQKGFAGVSFD